MYLGCIGDDFTGSGDLANTLAKQNMQTSLYCGIPSRPAERSVEAGVVALKSRTIPAEEAVAQSLAALEWLRAQGCEQFFFKYCST
ncbi:MAG: four-carbon acid sugar kinase family protein, partial [Bacteroidota bacterium]